METKQQIINKLREIGINSENCYPKKTFKHDGRIVISMYESEFEEDCYFAANFGKSLYKVPKTKEFNSLYTKDSYNNKDKWLVPSSEWELVWEDKPFEELPDAQFSTLTLRQYACIHLKVPDSGVEWLDGLIKNSHVINKEIIRG